MERGNYVRILISNDDGIQAPGLKALAKCAKEAGHTVYVAAPNGQRSAVSHGITISGYLFAEEMPYDGAEVAWAISGTPSDCVALGLKELCKDVDVVLSGVNNGYNGGVDILYSGTVAAALEAAIIEKPGFAISLGPESKDFEAAARLGIELMEKTIHLDLPKFSILNINYPDSGPAKGIRAVPARLTKYYNYYVKEALPDGRIGYRLDGYMQPIDVYGEDDYSWLKQGYATVSVLSHDLSNVEETRKLMKLVNCDNFGM